MCDEFASAVPSTTWHSITDHQAPFAKLPEYLARYQDPTAADAMSKVQVGIELATIGVHTRHVFTT